MNDIETIKSDLITLALANPGAGNAKLAACIIDRKNNIISYGFNRYKTHPLQSKFSSNPHSIFLHAEIDAIVNLLRRIRDEDFQKHSLLVARVWKNGNTANAKPCRGCQEALQTYNIGTILHTSSQGWNEMKLGDE